MSSNFLFQRRILYSCCLAACVVLISPITFLVNQYTKFSLTSALPFALSTYENVIVYACKPSIPIILNPLSMSA